MKTNFNELKKLIEGMCDDDYLMDNDLNLAVLNSKLRASIKTKLNMRNKIDISRLLTMVICFSENGRIDQEIISWSDEEYKEYLEGVDITEEQVSEYVEYFLKNL